MIIACAGRDEYVAKWVQEHIDGCQDFENYTTIGVLDDRRLICGAVYTNYRVHSIEFSLAAINPRWCTRKVLRVMFQYPFEQLKVDRLQATVSKKNKHTRKFAERLGFKYEGTGRRAFPDGSDACVYSMLPHECRWLKKGNT